MGKMYEFTKMHGLGNCYIYMDGITRPLDIPDMAALARRVSDPAFGIGSDGLILILPSDRADVKMRIFNKDGSEAKNCGNGLRCVARYCFEHQLVDKPAFEIETLSGNRHATVHTEHSVVTGVTIDMDQPILQRRLIPVAGGDGDRKVIRDKLTVFGTDYQFTAVSMGNPHALFFVDDVADAPIDQLGPLLADTYPLFPEGANIGFVHPISESAIDYRVWERGSGITQACGTGACAAVVASILEQRLPKDHPITVHLAGGDLTVQWDATTNHVLMTGSAEVICTGTYYDSQV
ncbi:diaminopimelate epimerase [Sporolactobacillus spathodeae]|uniref:Diaminopimelate epimerase n=2 Tax=Sporolactobacillus spathodeae TaxID=1465502 RepID=A0ABS2Q4T5_9BACL|nr:diaminopimelate epimerase [Sporolactobacillus spathodeae]